MVEEKLYSQAVYDLIKHVTKLRRQWWWAESDSDFLIQLLFVSNYYFYIGHFLGLISHSRIVLLFLSDINFTFQDGSFAPTDDIIYIMMVLFLQMMTLSLLG